MKISIMIEDLSIIIPAYNEEKRIMPTLRKLREFTDESGIDTEIIVVNDGSTDRTSAVIRSLNMPLVRVVELPKNSGKFAAVKRGFEEAEKSWVLLYDADGAAPISALKTVEPHTEEAECVIGSRAMASSKIMQTQKWWRTALGRIGNRVIRAFTGLPYADTQCGFKLIRSDLAKRAADVMSIDGFAGDVELLHIIRLHGGRVREVGIEWHDVPVSTVTFTDYFKTLGELLRIKRNIKKEIYK
ncbi:MAG: dolichyl-phosphate beta-glucosyltransferase [Candidatus Kerfeldbacteria bacterium]